MSIRPNVTSPFMVVDWNESIISTHRSYDKALAKANSITESAGSCVPAKVRVRKAWADVQRAKGNRRAVADALALCAEPGSYDYVK